MFCLCELFLNYIINILLRLSMHFTKVSFYCCFADKLSLQTDVICVTIVYLLLFHTLYIFYQFGKLNLDGLY